MLNVRKKKGEIKKKESAGASIVTLMLDEEPVLFEQGTAYSDLQNCSNVSYICSVHNVVL